MGYPTLDAARWGIIGCGDVTEVKSGPALQKAEGSSLVAVMRRNGELARDYAHRHGVPKWYDDAQSLINDPQVNAVYVATPPDTHAYYAKKAIDAGKPVYVEKPLAMNYIQSLVLANYAKERDVPLYSAYYRRALPYFAQIKEILGSGAVGELRFVSIRQSQPRREFPEGLPWRLRPEISGGGWFHDVGCHTLDIVDMLCGPIRRASGFSVNQAGVTPADDTVCAALSFENGALGGGLWCYDSYEKRESVVISGTKGSVAFGALTFTPIQIEEGGRRTALSVGNPPHVQQPLIQSVVDELRGRGKALSGVENALRTARVMDDILGV